MKPRHAAGQVMIEMVLALLILIPVLALLFFFGRGMVRAQRARVIDRYDAWREVAHARSLEPRAQEQIDGDAGAPLGPHPDGGSAHAALNRAFWGGRAASIGFDAGDALPNGAGEAFIDRAAARGEDARAMAEGLVDSLPAGHTSRFTTAHDETAPLWRRLDGPITHRHSRGGHAWAFANGWRVLSLKQGVVAGWGFQGMEVADAAGQTLRLVPAEPRLSERIVIAGGGVSTLLPDEGGFLVWQRRGPWASPEESVRSGFLSELDAPLSAMPGNPMAEAVRQIYLTQPGYRGPVLGF